MDPICVLVAGWVGGLMAGVVGGLVGKFRDLVVDLSWEQLLYFVCYDCKIGQLNRQLMELTLQRSSLQYQIDEAKNNGEQINETVLLWLCEVDELSKHVQKFHEESQEKIECNITSCPNPCLRYKLSKRAGKIAQEAIKIYGKRNFDRISYRVSLPSMVEITSREGNERIYSRDPIMNQILEELMNPIVNMIGLYGPGGVGKTTIAKEVGKKEVGKIQKIFEKVIIASVSQELNIEKIQGQIAEKLGMQLSENDKDVRAFRLCERLKQEKNMLLILDDLWEELHLDEIGIPLVGVENDSKKNEGCKILLTSRDKVLLSNLMKCQKIFEVGVLSVDEALELFKKIAKLSTDSSSPQLICIAIDIVRKCGGLPLAITTVAKALRNKDINVWKDALARLNNPFSTNNTLTREVDTIFKWSYDRLSSLEYKNIFLLAAMLSHDPSIEDLLMYSVGLDILDRENMEGARVGVSAIVSELKSLNLFIDSISSHRVTIHDIFRDAALRIASDEGLNVFHVKLHAFIRRRLKEWPNKNMLQGFEGICMQESDISDLPGGLHCPRLQFFLLNSKKWDLNIPNMFFKSSNELKVLAFTNVHFSSSSSLIFLHELKALCLHSCLLEDITDVGSLKNLKVLSLAYSAIQRLPIELAKLTSLQMLNLSYCFNLKVIPHKLLSSLKKLEVLHMGNSFHQWKVEGYSEANENASLDELTDLPLSSLDIHIPNISMLPENLFLDMNLTRYKISMGKHWGWQRNYETSKILERQLHSSIHLKGGVRKLLEGVEDLYLNGCNAHEDVLHSHEGRRFINLRHLQMDGNYGIRSNVFHSAHHEDATKNVSNKTFKSLFNSKVLLPELEILELSNLLYKLTPLIWDDQLSHDSFNILKVLVVKSCGFVKLVPLHVLKSLNNLEEVEVEDCTMLEIVFDFEDLNDYYKVMDSSSVVMPLKKLKLLGLPKLKNVWSNNCQGNVSFPSLRSVDVSYCESLTSIFPASIGKGMLGDLEELHIYTCNIDVIVAKDQVSESVAFAFQFPGLTSLKLYRLPQLTNFYPQRHTLAWPRLQQLSIEHCNELEIFKKEVSSSSEICEEESTLNSKHPIFSQDKVIHNLEELELASKPAEMIGSGQFPMYRFPKVKLLRLNVYNATTILYRTLLKSFPNLEELELIGYFVDASGGDDIAALASPFPKLTLSYILIEGSLSPLLVSSTNLTHIEVTYCNNITTLMTSSTARSLVHLTHLSIGKCTHIEEIITKQEGENDEDKEILFIKLKTLVLHDLYRFKRFCGNNYTFRFRLLDQLIIKACPSFKMFSPGFIDTPALKSIKLSQDGGKQHEVWDADLNKIVYQQRFMVSREVVLEKDDASMIRNDQFPVDRWPQVEILRIEGFVEEWVTFPYTLLERFPKMNELHVSNSSFREIFPSHAPFSTSFHNLTVLKVFECHHLVYLMTISTAKSLVNLETLEIFYCKKLEEIIRKDHNEGVEEIITLFNIKDTAANTRCMNMPLNLTHLNVKECGGLTTLMTSTIARSLVHLTHLSISNCYQIEEIITKQEGEDDEDNEIFFNKMKFLELDSLTRLKRFSGYNYTFRFLLLEHVTITECPRLIMFCPGAIHAPRLQSVQVDKYQAHIHIWKTDLKNSIQHLFTFEEVISNTMSMVINVKNITRIVDVFPKVSNLYVESFMDERVTFPCSSLEKFPKLKWLHVEHCSFDEIFPSQDQVIDLYGLYIVYMDRLKSIWKDDSQLPPIHQNLLHLEVKSCCSLVELAPSSASFQNLRELYVSECHQLIHLVTTTTAKSLVSLEKCEINECKRMEEIVMNVTNEDVQGGITFNKLDSIKLTDMPSLKMFSSQSHSFEFPKLEKIKITGCPEMKKFCPGVLKTPKLAKVKIEEHVIQWKDEEDLNKTMEGLSSAKDGINI